MTSPMRFKPSLIGHVVELTITYTPEYLAQAFVPENLKAAKVTKAGVLAFYGWDPTKEELYVQFTGAEGEQKYLLSAHDVDVRDWERPGRY
jgi:hypothetical protein